MGCHRIGAFRRHHPAWRLLTAENVPLIPSFSHRAFVQPNVRALSQGALVNTLEDFLLALREELGPDAIRGRHRNTSTTGRRMSVVAQVLPARHGRALFRPDPGDRNRFRWLAGLEERQFVGAELRLLTVFELLRQMVHGAEIGAIRAGCMAFMDDTQLKERFLFFQVEQHALALREAPPLEPVMKVGEPGPRVSLTMERSLFMPPFKPRIDQQVLGPRVGFGRLTGRLQTGMEALSDPDGPHPERGHFRSYRHVGH